MSDLAKRAGVHVTIFQDWLTADDWKHLIDLGWRPNRKKLTTPVVKFITDKYLPDYEQR